MGEDLGWGRGGAGVTVTTDGDRVVVTIAGGGAVARLAPEAAQTLAMMLLVRAHEAGPDARARAIR